MYAVRAAGSVQNPNQYRPGPAHDECDEQDHGAQQDDPAECGPEVERVAASDDEAQNQGKDEPRAEGRDEVGGRREPGVDESAGDQHERGNGPHEDAVHRTERGGGWQSRRLHVGAVCGGPRRGDLTEAPRPGRRDEEGAQRGRAGPDGAEHEDEQHDGEQPAGEPGHGRVPVGALVHRGRRR